MGINIKPCPCCGHEAKLKESTSESGCPIWVIVCPFCRLNMKASANNLSDLTTAWNDRIIDKDIAKENEKLKARLKGISMFFEILKEI